jgi:2-(1,2-epoxy-1,2-dihydrophenyl)acetyl-CoA isomerase
MEYKDILYEKSGDGFAVITLNRPERLNAFSKDMSESLREALKEADFDASVRVLIITGAGRGFCSGADVKAGAERRAAGEVPPKLTRYASVVRRNWSSLEPTGMAPTLGIMRRFSKPIICALNGPMAGFGSALAMHCDVIIASDKATYRNGFTRQGLTMEFATSYLIPQRIGTHKALELAYTNDMIDAEEMYRIGLVNKVVPHDQLIQACKEMGKKMFQIPPISLMIIKECVFKDSPMEQHQRYEGAMTRFMEGVDFQDGIEARTSFGQKREPKYTGD